jgi:hypothetical protein
MRNVFLVAVVVVATAGAADLGALHGTWNNVPFWSRLRAPDPALAGRQVLELVREPRPPAWPTLSDSPFLLLDDHRAILAWNDRHSLNQAQRKRGGYDIVREVAGAGPDDPHHEQRLHLAAPPSWDIHVAPLLLAWTWRPGGSATRPAVDLFGGRAAAGEIAWDDTTARIDGRAYAITSAQGRLQRLDPVDAADLGTPLLIVAGWLPEVAPP